MKGDADLGFRKGVLQKTRNKNKKKAKGGKKKWGEGSRLF